MRGTEGTGWQVANEITKPQVSINSNNSSIDCSLHCKKTATGNGNLQPEVEIRVVKNYSRVVLQYSRQPYAQLCNLRLSAHLHLHGPDLTVSCRHSSVMWG